MSRLRSSVLMAMPLWLMLLSSHDRSRFIGVVHRMSVLKWPGSGGAMNCDELHMDEERMAAARPRALWLSAFSRSSPPPFPTIPDIVLSSGDGLIVSVRVNRLPLFVLIG